jgi:dipicolinate synthase subunit A
MNGKRVLVIGGGIRLQKAAEAFAEDGFSVNLFDGKEALKSAVDECDIIVLGIPATSDNLTLNADNLSTEVSLRDIAMLAGKKRLVVGGRLTEHTKALLDIYSVRWADYALRDEFEILNAVPTAEGAIQIALEEFPFTLQGSSVIVTGYGKVAKALSERLHALGAKVTVCARRAEARAEARSANLSAIDFEALPECAKHCDILFNTVPAKVIGRDALASLGKGRGVIDLASKPGGVDLDEAKTLGINVIWALSLPGKCAPLTAGKIIEETVRSIADELKI